MWDRVRAWSKQTGRDPNDLKRQEQHEALEQKSGPTWAAADAFLEYTRTCERTKQGIVLGAATRALPGVGQYVVNASVETLSAVKDPFRPVLQVAP